MRSHSMQVRLSDLTPAGLTINDTIPLKPLNDRMNEGAENDIEFLTAPVVSMKIWRTAQGAETSGTVTTTFRQPCARCIKEIDSPLEVEANFILKPTSLDAPANEQDGVGIIFYSGDHVALEDVLQESLILALSPFLYPKTDPDGACSLCGKPGETEAEQSKGATNSLAGLLKNAGIKH